MVKPKNKEIPFRQWIREHGGPPEAMRQELKLQVADMGGCSCGHCDHILSYISRKRGEAQWDMEARVAELAFVGFVAVADKIAEEEGQRGT